VLLSALGVVGFLLVRSGSSFLAAEQEAEPCRALARQYGLSPATVLALRAQALELPAAAFGARVAEFAALAKELGEPLAAVAVAADPASDGSPGGEVAARAALQRAGGDAEAAWREFRREPAALPGVEFELLRGRFERRRSGRG
jgi:hypothetical protein